MNNPNIGVLGGDARYIHLANALSRDGYEVHCMFLDSPRLARGVHRAEDFRDALPFCAALLLPTPVCGQGLELNAPYWPQDRNRDIGQFLGDIGKTALVLGGAFSPAVKAAFAAKELRFIDLMERDDLAAANALPTAEGAVAMAMEQMEITLSGSRSCVVGCGRCGRVLARLLAAMGSRVTVTARRPGQLTWIADQGWTPLETGRLAQGAGEWDVVFNTVPAPVVDRRVLDALGPGAVVIDLASRPGSTDFPYAAQRGITAVLAPGLPGKVAPKTAGLILRDTILPILRERGISV